MLDILEDMYYKELNFKGVKVNIFGIPSFLIRNKNSYYSTLNRLKHGGYIVRDGNGWRTTIEGRKRIKKADTLRSFDSPFSNDSKKNLLLIFDIPEGIRFKRDWLRAHLNKFKYIMVQKSVWVGPSPLPKEFIVYVKEIKIAKYIKTYRLSSAHKQGKTIAH